jgi:hypothetical protein
VSGRNARATLARSLRAHTARHVGQLSRNVHYGIVRQVSPLQVELEGHDITLDEEELVVSQWVRRYGYDYGLNPGDTVLVAHMPNDDFVVHDVIATAKIENGLDLDNIAASADPTLSGSDPQGGTVTITSSAHITKKVPLLDATGAILGYIPVYGTLP